MDNESYSSAKLLAAACLAFCGVVIMAVGIATAGMPSQGPVCLTLAPIPCCSLNAEVLAEAAPRVAGPGLHAVRVVTD